MYEYPVDSEKPSTFQGLLSTDLQNPYPMSEASFMLKPMEKIFNFDWDIRTIDQMVFRDNLKRSEITKLRQTGKLYNIRRGLYIDSEKYQALPPWDKYTAQLVAFARVAKEPIFSHESAAIFHSLSLVKVPQKIHVYCAPSSRGTSRDVSKHPLLTEDTQLVSCMGSPNAHMTSLLTTLTDCIAKMSFEEGVVLADSALKEHKVSQEILREALLNYRRKNFEKVHAVAHAMSRKSESPGESLTRLLLDKLGLDYQEQYDFTYESRYYRGDFYLEEYDLFIEFDGRLKYEVFQPREKVVHRERLREREILKMGHRLFRVDWDDVYRHPDRTMYELRRYIEKIEAQKKAA